MDAIKYAVVTMKRKQALNVIEDEASVIAVNVPDWLDSGIRRGCPDLPISNAVPLTSLKTAFSDQDPRLLRQIPVLRMRKQAV